MVGGGGGKGSAPGGAIAAHGDDHRAGGGQQPFECPQLVASKRTTVQVIAFDHQPLETERSGQYRMLLRRRWKVAEGGAGRRNWQPLEQRESHEKSVQLLGFDEQGSAGGTPGQPD
jgi:hypothetical protein